MTSTEPMLQGPLTEQELERIHAWWRAANYLTVGQIYLMDNPLLREPLAPEHIKPRLLGHWGTSPGLNMIYAHANRQIRRRDLDAIYVIGPGHGGPAIVANTWLEGTYSELYPSVSRDEPGMQRLFRQFSFPGGIPSHVAPEVPGSIHEGGELGYSLMHAYGAAFDNPDLVVFCVIGDGEMETGPLSASWLSNVVPQPGPGRRGAAHPAPQRLEDRQSDAGRPDGRRGLVQPAARLGVRADRWSRATTRWSCTRRWPRPWTRPWTRSGEIQQYARGTGDGTRPRWPMIVFRTPKGWTGPKEVDGLPVEGTFRAHQVPLSDPRGNPGHRAQLESWLRSYAPEELFDATGSPLAEITGLAPAGTAPDEREPACQRRRAAARSGAPGLPRVRRERPAAWSRRPRSPAAGCAT